MKHLVILATGLFISCNTSQKTVSEKVQTQQPIDPVKYAQTITEEELKEHLYTYASDEFEGRETGKPGQKKAVEYLQKQYKDMGVGAGKKDGNYFQKVPLEVSKVPQGDMMVGTTSFELGEDILTFSAATGDFTGIVYAGYGVEENGYSDYTGIDVVGKLALIKAGEPMDGNGNYVVSGTQEKSVWSNMSEAMQKKLELAVEKGALGILYYDTTNFPRYKRYFDYMKTNNSGRMQLAADSNDNFVIILNKKSAQALKTDIEKDDVAKPLPVEVKLDITSGNDTVDSENVVAVVKGTEKPDEYVVVSSHLDHLRLLQYGPNGMKPRHTHQVFRFL